MLMTINTDPMSILSGDGFEVETGANAVYTLLNLGSLYSVILMILILVGGIAILATTIMLLVVRKKETRAEYKKGIGFKLLLIFVAVNVITIFNILLLVGQALQATT